MTTRLWMVVLASVSASFSLCAQQPGGAGVWQKFQDKLAPIADYSVTMVTLSGGNSSTSRMARLAPKMRMEMETPGMGSMAMIMDPEAANDKGGKGVSYTLFVAQKMYMKQALTPAGARTKTDADLKGLVYSLTPKLKDDESAWYLRPAVLGVVLLLGCAVLNYIFW